MQIIFIAFTIVCSCAIILASLLGCSKLNHTILLVWGHSIFWLHRISIGTNGRTITEKAYIAMSNHQSNLDPNLLLAMASSTLRFVSKIELVFLPIFGIASYLAGNIHIRRKDRSKAISTLSQAVPIVQNGRHVVVFPEGTRSSNPPEFLPFKKGGFLLAIEAQLPIIPIGLAGTGKCWPKNSFIPRAGKVSICIGEPIPTEGLTPDDRDILIQKVRQAIEILQKEAEKKLV